MTYLETYTGAHPVDVHSTYIDRRGVLRAKISGWLLNDVYAHSIVEAESKEAAELAFADGCHVCAAKADFE